jgi:hypothetical protein
VTLGEKRREFSYMLAQLIVWCVEQGYEVQIEDVHRSQAQANANAASGAGIAHSLHLDGLAGDLSIFKGGVLLRSVDEYRPIGERWKGMHPENCWGGDFHTRPDADHFSRSHNGVK